jgi:hypothetical protein
MKYRNSVPSEKERSKKDALIYLKKKKFYEDYLNRLNRYQIEIIKSDIKRVNEDMKNMAKETEMIQKEMIRQRNLSIENATKYEIDIDENVLNEEFEKILGDLDKLEVGVDLTKYFN